MDWLSVISLIVIGIVLIIVEVIFIPGTTIIGIFGAVFLVGGIAMAYSNFGNPTGTYVMVSTLGILGVILFIAFKSGAWTAFALKDTITSRVNDEDANTVQVGQRGMSLSSLRPFGKAEFNDKVYEVTSIGNYVDADQEVEVIRIEGNKIYVEPLKS
ncbi:MAG: NfeD family protein [Cyclobacteriaceae bacterium]|nr:NfeD family protein [Cyclobacteriaceae bacterium]